MEVDNLFPCPLVGFRELLSLQGLKLDYQLAVVDSMLVMQLMQFVCSFVSI